VKYIGLVKYIENKILEKNVSFVQKLHKSSLHKKISTNASNDHLT